MALFSFQIKCSSTGSNFKGHSLYEWWRSSGYGLFHEQRTRRWFLRRMFLYFLIFSIIIGSVCPFSPYLTYIRWTYVSFSVLKFVISYKAKKDQSLDWSWIFCITNCLIVTPTHDAYLEDGTYIGLTVDIHILAYTIHNVNILT